MFFGHKNIRNIKAAHSMGDINFCSSVLLSKNKGSTQNMFFCSSVKKKKEHMKFVLLFFCLKNTSSVYNL